MQHGSSIRVTGFLLACLALTAAAPAATVGYEARFFGSNNNIPRLQLSNVSDTASIVEFVLTLQRDAFQFDYARILDTSGNVEGALVDPEELQGGQRSDKVEYSFDPFEPGASFSFKTDVDPVDQNKRVDYRIALFDLDGGDPADNAEVLVRFSDGTSLGATLPAFDPDAQGNVNFGQTRTDPPVIPLPPGVWAGLGLLAIAGIGSSVRRRWRRHDSL